MKVFISWSGDLSHKVAELLSTWIGDVLQGVKTWISSNDIEKGSLWFGEISDQFEDTGIGIICISRENMNSPWILFEAGALSKGLTENRVCPLLIDLEFKDLHPPLSQFNGTLPNKKDIFKLVNVINSQNHTNALSPDSIKKAFEKWWPDFENEFSEITKGYKTAQVKQSRSAEDMIEEILQISRSIQRNMHRKPQLKLNFSTQYDDPETPNSGYFDASGRIDDEHPLTYSDDE